MKSATRGTPGLKSPVFEITFRPGIAIMPVADSSTLTLCQERRPSGGERQGGIDVQANN